MNFFSEAKTLYVCHSIGEPTDLLYSLIIGWSIVDGVLYPWIARDGGTGANNELSPLERVEDIIAITPHLPNPGKYFYGED